MNRMHWYVAATYIGAIIGAGFASGQEGLIFFVAYGKWGMVGVGLVTGGLMLSGALNFAAAQVLQVPSYRQLLEVACGHRLGKLYDVIITSFLLAGVAVMLAGSASLVSQQWQWPPLIGALLTASLAAISAIHDFRGVMWVNTLLVPMICLVTLALGLEGAICLLPQALYEPNTVLWAVSSSPLLPWWWTAAGTYLAYNTILGVAVCASIGGSLPRVQPAWRGGIYGGLGLGTLLLAEVVALWAGGPVVAKTEVPMAFITRHIGPVVETVYSLSIWSAMLTTAATNVFAVARRLTSHVSPALVGGLLAGSLLFSLLGFTAIIEFLYPLVGYVGGVYLVLSILRLPTIIQHNGR